MSSLVDPSYHRRSRLQLCSLSKKAHRWLANQPLFKEDKKATNHAVFNPWMDKALVKYIIPETSHLLFRSAEELESALKAIVGACCKTFQQMCDGIFMFKDALLDTEMSQKEVRKRSVSYCLDVALPQAVNVLELWDAGMKELAKSAFFTFPNCDGRVKTPQHYANFIRNLRCHCPEYESFESYIKSTFSAIEACADCYPRKYQERYKATLESIVAKCVRIVNECACFASIIGPMSPSHFPDQLFKLNAFCYSENHVVNWKLFVVRCNAGRTLLPALGSLNSQMHILRAAEEAAASGETREINKLLCKFSSQCSEIAQIDNSSNQSQDRSEFQRWCKPYQSGALLEEEDCHDQRASVISREIQNFDSSISTEDSTAELSHQIPVLSSPPLCSDSFPKKRKDVDHPLMRCRSDVLPGQKFFLCPFCDKAKVVLPTSSGYDLLKCVPAADGYLPIDQDIEQSVRHMSGWKKMRKHCIDCCIRRRFSGSAADRELYENDKLHVENFLPLIFRRKNSPPKKRTSDTKLARSKPCKKQKDARFFFSNACHTRVTSLS